MGVDEGSAHEARRRGDVARDALHTRSDAPCLQLLGSPMRRLLIFVRCMEVVVQIVDMPRKLRGIRQYVCVVFVDVKAFLGAFHHDAARVVGDHPMQKRFRPVWLRK